MDWIQSVYVRPESRHQWVFKELFDFAKTIAQSEGAGALRLYVDRHNVNAQKVYQSLGMHEPLSDVRAIETEKALRRLPKCL